MSERRDGVRHLATFRVRLGFPDVDAFVSGYAVNISRGGIYIPTKQPKPKGTDIRFEILLKDGSVAVSGAGKVAWSAPFDPAHPASRYGMGVQFVSLDSASDDIVQRALSWRSSHAVTGKASGKIPGEQGTGGDARPARAAESRAAAPGPAPASEPDSGGETPPDRAADRGAPQPEPPRVDEPPGTVRAAAAVPPEKPSPAPAASDGVARRAKLAEIDDRLATLRARPGARVPAGAPPKAEPAVRVDRAPPAPAPSPARPGMVARTAAPEPAEEPPAAPMAAPEAAPKAASKAAPKPVPAAEAEEPAVASPVAEPESAIETRAPDGIGGESDGPIGGSGPGGVALPSASEIDLVMDSLRIDASSDEAPAPDAAGERAEIDLPGWDEEQPVSLLSMTKETEAADPFGVGGAMAAPASSRVIEMGEDDFDLDQIVRESTGHSPSGEISVQFAGQEEDPAGRPMEAVGPSDSSSPFETAVSELSTSFADRGHDLGEEDDYPEMQIGEEPAIQSSTVPAKPSMADLPPPPDIAPPIPVAPAGGAKKGGLFRKLFGKKR